MDFFYCCSILLKSALQKDGLTGYLMPCSLKWSKHYQTCNHMSEVKVTIISRVMPSKVIIPNVHKYAHLPDSLFSGMSAKYRFMTVHLFSSSSVLMLNCLQTLINISKMASCPEDQVSRFVSWNLTLLIFFKWIQACCQHSTGLECCQFIYEVNLGFWR